MRYKKKAAGKPFLGVLLSLSMFWANVPIAAQEEVTAETGTKAELQNETELPNDAAEKETESADPESKKTPESEDTEVTECEEQETTPTLPEAATPESSARTDSTAEETETEASSTEDTEEDIEEQIQTEDDVQPETVNLAVTALSACATTAEHTYSEPKFIWSEDGSACSALFICTEDASHTETVPCTISEDRTVSGKVTYTASVTMNGQTYTNSCTVEKVVIDIEISWGDMAFTYSAGSWNTGTKTYDNAGWTVDTAHGNEVTITNKSNVRMNASITYVNQEDYSFGSSWEVNASDAGDLTEDDTTLQAAILTTDVDHTAQSDLALGDGQVTFALMLNGEPQKALTGEEIGTVTITLTQSAETQ